MLSKQNDTPTNPTYETLGGRIVAAREALGLTTAQLARRLGVKSATLHNWECDRSEPRSNKLFMLAGLLNVSPLWLMNGLGEAPSENGTATGDEPFMRDRLVDLRDRASKLVADIDAILVSLDRR